MDPNYVVFIDGLFRWQGVKITLKRLKQLPEKPKKKNACDTRVNARGSAWKTPKGIHKGENKMLSKLTWSMLETGVGNAKTYKRVKTLKASQGKMLVTRGLTRMDPRGKSHREPTRGDNIEVEHA